jgi:hypothetical protein
MKKGGGEVVVKIHTFLILALKACGRSASSLVPLTPVRSCPVNTGYENGRAS